MHSGLTSLTPFTMNNCAPLVGDGAPPTVLTHAEIQASIGVISPLEASTGKATTVMQPSLVGGGLCETNLQNQSTRLHLDSLSSKKS